jgi:hypothetical protein
MQTSLFLRTAVRGVFRFFSSLRLTVALLAAGCVLVVLGTLDVNWQDIHRVQKEYFEAWFALFPLQPAETASGAAAAAAAPLPSWVRVPLPGGFLLGAFFLVNLVCAHFRFFRLRFGNIGVALIHIGIVVLLVGGFVTAQQQQEFRLHIPEGAESGDLISEGFWRDPKLEAFNKNLRGASHREIVRKIETQARESGHVRKLDFTLRLEKFTREYHPGTNIPKTYSSRVVVREPAAPDASGKVPPPTERPAEIAMNHPLRHGGYTFYQSSFWTDERDEMGQPLARPLEITVLQVVRNAGWWLPYASTLLISVGLLLQFLTSLWKSLRRRKTVVAAA